MTNNNVVDIKGKLADEAVGFLQPVMVEMYDTYGLDIILATVTYFIARGIIYEEDLTDLERANKLEKVKFSLDLYTKYWQENKEDSLLTP